MRVSSAAAITIDPRSAISCLSKPTALAGLDDRSELEQTSSARFPVTCAAVVAVGLISYRSQAIPARVSATAASHPARPAPMTTGVRLLEKCACMMLLHIRLER